MGRSLIQRIHNPQNRGCGCDADCWCNRTAVGRTVKWWFPARRFGIRHKMTFINRMTPDERAVWKRQQDARDGLQEMVGWQAQPRYEKIVRLGPMRFGMTVRPAGGKTAVHELFGRPQ